MIDSVEAVEIPYIIAILKCTAGVKHVLQRSGLYKPELQLCTKDVFTTKVDSKSTKLEPFLISICCFVGIFACSLNVYEYQSP